MKFAGTIDALENAQKDMTVEKVGTLPAFTAADEGKIIHVTSGGDQGYHGGIGTPIDDWVKLNVAAGGDVYIRTVAASGGNFTDLAAALTDFDSNSAKIALILIRGSVPAGLSGAATITKPVKLLGTTTDAEIQLQTNLITVNPTATNAQPTLEVENLKVSRVVGITGGILFNDDAIIRMKDCLIDDNATSTPTRAIFETASLKKLTLFAERTTFESASAGILFESGATAGIGLEVHLSACRALRSVLPGDLFTCIGSSVDIFVRERTLLDRVDIVATAQNVEIIYQGNNSLVSDQSDITAGSITVRGEAGVDEEMAAAVSNFNAIQLILQNFVGNSILIREGTYDTDTTISLSGNHAGKRIRGEGPATKITKTDPGATLSAGGATGLILQDFTISAASGGSSGPLVLTSNDMIVRNVVAEIPGGTKDDAVSSTGTGCLFDHVTVDLTGGDLNNNALTVTGAGSTVRQCRIDMAGSTVETVTGIQIGADGIVENCRITGKFKTGILSNNAGSVIRDNFIDQTDLVTITAGAACINIGASTDSLVTGNRIKTVNVVGIKADQTAATNPRSVIRGNFIENGRAASIGIQVVTRLNGLAEISDNNIWNSSGVATMAVGIRLKTDNVANDQREHVAVRNNTIQKMITGGIEALLGENVAGGNTQRGPSICGNNIWFVTTTAATFGIFVDGDVNSSPNRTEGTQINNNFVHMGTDTTPGNGIEVYDLKDSSVSGNHVEGKEVAGSSIGIRIQDCIDSQFNTNRVLGFDIGMKTFSTALDDSTQNQYGINHLRGNVTSAIIHEANETEIQEVFTKD